MTIDEPENTIHDPDLALAARKGAIKQLTIVQTGEGFYIVVKLNRGDESIVLTTRRERDQPRYFKHFERLITHIRESYPGVADIRMRFVEPYPANKQLKYVGEPEIKLAIQQRSVTRVAKRPAKVTKRRK